jgi:metal-sulfur cluster biosynthetic enzyme
MQSQLNQPSGNPAYLAVAAGSRASRRISVVVFDPPWHPDLMSEAAKLQLGFDVDHGTTPASLPVYDMECLYRAQAFN